MPTHGAARKATIDALSKREPFQRKGFAMSAYEGKFNGTGRLTGDALAIYSGAQNVTYTVLSYGTPIAWVADGELCIPVVSYSVTTTQHQNLCRTYL